MIKWIAGGAWQVIRGLQGGRHAKHYTSTQVQGSGGVATTPKRSTRVEAQPTPSRADADALWRQVESADRLAARARVAALRKRHPRAAPATLHRRLVQAKCVQAGAVGAISGLAAFLPGPFRALGTALGPLADATLVTTLQGELVLETFALYDVDMPQSAERFAVFAIAASNVGSVAVSHRLTTSLARFASQSLGGRVIATAAPLVGLATTVAANIGFTYAIGQRALAVARLRDADLAEWPGLLRSVTELDERKLVSWAQQSARAAVAQVGASTRDWVRRLGSMLPARATASTPAKASPRRVPATTRTGKPAARKPVTVAKPRAASKRTKATTKSPTSRKPTTGPRPRAASNRTKATARSPSARKVASRAPAKKRAVKSARNTAR